MNDVIVKCSNKTSGLRIARPVKLGGDCPRCGGSPQRHPEGRMDLVIVG